MRDGSFCVLLQTGTPLCEHCPSSDGTRKWVWYLVANAEGKPEIKVVCQECGAEMLVHHADMRLYFRLVSRKFGESSVTEAPPPPKRDYEGIPYAEEFTKYDETFLRSMRISPEGITLGKRIDGAPKEKKE